VKAAQFIEFCARVGVTLEPGQRVFWSVVADGVEPGEFEGDDRELSRAMFGDIETVSPFARSHVAAIKGADIGFTYVGALYSLWRALTADVSEAALNEIRPALIVAPDLRLGRIPVRVALGAAESVPAIRALIESQGTDGFVLRRERGRRTSVECLPATAGGRAVRGRRYVSAILDESAFFRSSDYAVNDVDIRRALRPRVVGQLISGSTPWLESADVWQTYERNFGSPIDALAVRMPTLLVRTEQRVIDLVAAERERDPDGAATEFDCVLPSAAGSLLLDGPSILRCVDDERPLVLARNFGVWRCLAGDLAFVSDHSAFLVLADDGKGVLHWVDYVELAPAPGRPIKPSHAIAAGAALALRTGTKALCADGHYAESAKENLATHAMSFVPLPAGATGKLDQFMALRDVVREGRLRIPRLPRLIEQLKLIVAKPSSAGGLTITLPRKRGLGHSDLAAALAGAIYMLETARRQPRRSRRNLSALPPA